MVGVPARQRRREQPATKVVEVIFMAGFGLLGCRGVGGGCAVVIRRGRGGGRGCERMRVYPPGAAVLACG